MTLIEELETIGQRTIGHVDDRVYYYGHRNNILKFINRPFYIPTNPQTPGQTERRERFIVGVDAWHNLDPSEVEAWNKKVSRLSYSMTGFNFFMSFILRGKFDMIKSIQKGAVLLNNGDNPITINSIDTTKSIIMINTFLASHMDGVLTSFGITGAGIVNPTTILIQAIKVNIVLDLYGYWQVIEFL